MSKKLLYSAALAVGMVWGVSVATTAQAAVIGLFDYAYNIDGTVSDILLDLDPVPGAANEAGFNAATGLGTISVTIGGAGAHYIALFVDHEIDEADNTFFNEFGVKTGAPAAGQSWEIDEPDFVFGDIFFNFLASSLDDSNSVASGLEDDVSMAIGWDFVLGAGQTGIVSFTVSEAMPNGGFFLTHTDPDSDASIYFFSGLTIRDEGIPQVDAPAAGVIFGLGLLTLACIRRRRTVRAAA